MNIQIDLQRKPEDYRLDNCVIDVVEEMKHESFETFQNYPTARYGAITNSLHRLPEDSKDERHCILLLDADGDDGFIVNPHGADYARYSAFVPNARQIYRLGQYPSLNEFSSDMEKLVEHYALEILLNQKDGQYQFSMTTVSDYYLEKFDGSLDSELFLNMLSECHEIAEIEEYGEELTAKVKPAFRKTSNVRNLSQKELDVICAKHTLWLNDAGGEQADLSNCVLKGLFLRGRDLSHAYCNYTVFNDCNLDSVDFSGAELESARFTNCGMKDLFAVKTNFIDAELENCDLSDATIAESLMMKLSYEYVKDCDDGKLKRLSNEEVTEIINKHDEAIILGEDYRADFSNCLIENFDFGIHDIHEMNFRGATMRFCSFALSDIRKVDFRNATFYRCKMHESTIGNCSFNEAKFYNCEMDTTDYIYCDFEKASFYYSPCFESNFMCCDLSDIQEDHSYVDEKKIIWTFDSSSYENLYPTIGIGDEEDW